MSTFQKWSDSALPSVRDALQLLASSGPVDTGALHSSAHITGPLPIDVLAVTGRDRVRFLNAMLSNDVVLLDGAGPDHGVRATLSSVQGRLVADTHLYLVDQEKKTGSMLALFEADASHAFVEMLDKYVIAEKVYFEPAELVAIAICGPGAEETLRAAGADLPHESHHAHIATKVGGIPTRIIRRDLGVPEGHLLLVTEGEVDALSASLNLPSATLEQLEAARIEGPLPRAGGDMTPLNIVLEAGLKDRAVSFTKGCYIGQEVICRIDSMGTPARLLVQLQGGEEPPSPGTELFRDGKAVGYVTSAVDSVRLGGPVFLGYVKKRSNEPGTALQVGEADGPSAEIQAVV